MDISLFLYASCRLDSAGKPVELGVPFVAPSDKAAENILRRSLKQDQLQEIDVSGFRLVYLGKWFPYDFEQPIKDSCCSPLRRFDEFMKIDKPLDLLRQQLKDLQDLIARQEALEEELEDQEQKKREEKINAEVEKVQVSE